MRKIALMSTVALLALSLMIIVSPVKAVTKEHYWCHMEFSVIDVPGKYWVSEEGILHMLDWHWLGSYVGVLGTGTMDVWFAQVSLDLATGKGTFQGAWLITITPQNTLGGYGRGIITGYVFFSGTFMGTHGTGAFEGVKKMGSFSGNMASLPYIMDAWGTIMYP